MRPQGTIVKATTILAHCYCMAIKRCSMCACTHVCYWTGLHCCFVTQFKCIVKLLSLVEELAPKNARSQCIGRALINKWNEISCCCHPKLGGSEKYWGGQFQPPSLFLQNVSGLSCGSLIQLRQHCLLLALLVPLFRGPRLHVMFLIPLLPLLIFCHLIRCYFPRASRPHVSPGSWLLRTRSFDCLVV